MLRRLRRRFGMAAPRVMVRAHIPWHWRALVTVLLLAVVIAMAGWVYDFGRRYAGYDKSVAEVELNTLRERVAILEAETARLRGIGNGSEASIEIERSAQRILGEEVKRLGAENGRLREDLAAFENLATGGVRNETVTIQRAQVESDATEPGSYRYRLLIAAPGARPDQEFKGRLQLVATVQQDGKPVIVNIPDVASADVQKYLVSFKYFRRIEGVFTLPANAVLKKLEVRLMQGATMVTAQQATM